MCYHNFKKIKITSPLYFCWSPIISYQILSLVFCGTKVPGLPTSRFYIHWLQSPLGQDIPNRFRVHYFVHLVRPASPDFPLGGCWRDWFLNRPAGRLLIACIRISFFFRSCPLWRHVCSSLGYSSTRYKSFEAGRWTPGEAVKSFFPFQKSLVIDCGGHGVRKWRDWSFPNGSFSCEHKSYVPSAKYILHGGSERCTYYY